MCDTSLPFLDISSSDVMSKLIPGGTHTHPIPTRHPEFWFSDGSVVLCTREVLFRVHKSVLARHSLVFRDMFSLPQPQPQPPCSDCNDCKDDVVGKAEREKRGAEMRYENEDVVLEGCPVVPLHDSPDDVASLLYALYDGPKFDNNSSADFRVVSGILRLASKYEIDGLRSRALAHLSMAWPATLQEWDAREAQASCVGAEEPRFYPNPVEVINLARDVNAPSLLPSAFFDLSRYSLSEVFEHSRRASDDTAQHLDVPNHAELSLADTQRLALGKEAAHCAVTALIRSLATEARSNPSHMQAHVNGGHHRARGFAARHQHRRADSTSGGTGRCASPASCWRDVCELVDLATQHYLFDREHGAADPLYVAEELALLKEYNQPEAPAGVGRVDLGGPSSGAGSANGLGGAGLLIEDLAESGTCRACARAFEGWAKKERERLWRAIPGWFKLEL